MEELKVVIQMREDRALVGVQGKDTDPVLEPVQAPDNITTLEAALAAVPAIVDRARARWAATPKNPAYERPPEPVRAARPALATPGAKATTDGVHTPSLFDD
jgi:hypothetical protein